MAIKIICKGCGKIMSDVEAFCPKCGLPAELSAKPESFGGRTMAAAGRSIRRDSWRMEHKSHDQGHVFDTGESFAEIGSAHKENKTKKKAGNVAKQAKPAKSSNTMKSTSASMKQTATTMNIGGGSAANSKGKPKKSGKSIALTIIAFVVVLNIISAACDSFSDYMGDTPFFEAVEEWGENLDSNEDGDGFQSVLAASVQTRIATFDEMNENGSFDSMTDQELLDAYYDMVLQEYNSIESYQYLDLGSDNLNLYRDYYFTGLIKQLDALNNLYNEEDADFYELWFDGYLYRTESLIWLYRDFDFYIPLEIYEQYQAGYNAYVEDAYDGDGEISAIEDLDIFNQNIIDSWSEGQGIPWEVI